MNDYYRVGKGDEYVEVSLDWEDPNYTKLLWWLKDITTTENNEKDFKKAILEVADSIKD